MSTSLPQVISEDIRRGKYLAGDDYTPPQIAQWFREEKEAFFADDHGNSHIDPFYAYMRSLTVRLGGDAFRGNGSVPRTLLTLGPGPGLEVDEILMAGGAWNLVFIEASDNFRTELKGRFPRAVVAPANESGVLDASSESVDVIVALSVLHHIPNVSFVLGEFARVLRPGGFAIVREPCSSMGDWRRPRSATPNERGISKRWMLDRAIAADLIPVGKPRAVLFHPLALLTKRLGLGGLMHTGWYFWLDVLVSRLFQINDAYWRDQWYKKLGPSAYFYVFLKRAQQP